MSKKDTMENKFIYSEEEGKFLVKLAREALTEYIKSGKRISVPKETPQKLLKKSGVFVTIKTFKENTENLPLRGCIGRPYPTYPLAEATIISAIDSGINDWRFRRVSAKELEDIVFEVTALTPPVEIHAKTLQERLDAIEIGRDGLICELKGAPKGQGGLFLPQVPVEWHWDKETYLKELCGKAGLPSSLWNDLEKIRLYKFQGEIFAEKKPKGEITRILL
ncbi:MAG: TIGR00296 family protein [Promethearchaeota archaeon]